MYRKLIYTMWLCMIFTPLSSQTKISNLSCEHLINPIGIDVMKPRLSWKLESSQKNVSQIAYQIQVYLTEQGESNSLIWDSGKVPSSNSILQEYSGRPLAKGKRYYWRVKVWDNKSSESSWSAMSYWEMGIALWQAKWVDGEQDIDTAKTPPCIVMRKDFNITKKVASARLYVTSRGLNTMYINGSRVGDDYFTPGWTSYQDHIQYYTYDITLHLQNGENAIGAVMADGWYRGNLAWEKNRNVYGKRLALLAQINITYTDGSTQTLGTDATWKATDKGPIRMSDIYHGETYDARMDLGAWSSPQYPDATWWPVKVVDFTMSNLVSPCSQSVRKTQEIAPIKIIKTPEGDDVIDFGQEITGWIKMKVNGSRGDTVTIQHAEVLDKKGNFYNANLRAAKCELKYILKGGSNEIYEPYFTFQGFRYIRIKGYKGPILLNNFVAYVIHTDMPKTGDFTCSNPMLNKLQNNIQWGQRGNFLDVPTDCPQRDERLGWTGDAQAFSRTASFNYNVAGFFTKWFKDVRAEQAQDGTIPFVIPDVLQNKNTQHKQPSAGWADVVTIAPWTMYQIYNDKRMLEVHYASMVKWVEYMASKANNYIYSGSVFGDWLFYQPSMEGHTEKNGYTDLDYISTAFFAHSVDLTRRAAIELGKKADVKKYTDLLSKIKIAFNREYVAASGRTISDSQTSYVLGLMFNLFDDKDKKAAAAQLVKDIKSRNNHLSTGFLGTPYLCHVLSNHGYTDVAYDLLFQETYPSWLYPVKMGATTIWERWDGIRTDSTFQSVGMNSFNHYAYGAIGDWMYRVVAGIELASPGYKHIIIQPRPTSKLQFAKASFESSYGTIESGWKYENDNSIKIKVKIPVNTTATVVLPVTDIGAIHWDGSSADIKKTNNGAEIEIGSGEYEFHIAKSK